MKRHIKEYSIRKAKWIGLYHREVLRVYKLYMTTLVSPLLLLSVYLIVFGLVLGGRIEMSRDHYFTFLSSGLLGLTLIKNSYENTSFSIMNGKYTDELQELKILPFSSLDLLLGLGLSSLTRALINGASLFLIILAISCFTKLHFPLPARFFLLLYALPVTSLTFSFLGSAISLRANSYEYINGISSLLLTPMLYLGGTFFPLSFLSLKMQTLILLNPIAYFLSLIRNCFTETVDIPLPISISVTFLCFLLSILFFLHEEKQPRNFFRS